MTTTKKVIAAMSGGVDSSTAAYLLKENGYNVIGITLKLFPQGSKCCNISDINDARFVAGKLNIPFYVLDYEKEFEELVVKYFCDEYIAGKTPNPCVLCNEQVKFELLIRYAAEIGADFIATGHYAKIEYMDNNPILKKGTDIKKDQSYFLYRLSAEQLNRILFPLGNYTKEKIREIAQSADLVTAKKKDSQEVCFIPDGNYSKFIENKINRKIQSGNIINSESGVMLGKHKGIINYTIGQRRGLGVASNEPLYVNKIDAENNIVYVGSWNTVLKKELIASNLKMNTFKDFGAPFFCQAKIRHSHKQAAAEVIKLSNDRIKVVFENEQASITPGQSVVLYENDIVIGGGIIE